MTARPARLLQTTGQITDVRGPPILGAINGGLPSVPNPSFDGKRAVYNMIPTTKEGDPSYVAVFGTGGAICANPNQITNNGSGVNPTCGVIDAPTAPFLVP